MKYLGLDYGEKRVGVAVSDEEGKIAFPREEIANNHSLLKHIAHLVEEEHVGKVVVGDTRSWEGKENIVTAQVEAFVAKLAETVAIPCEFAPEAGSSVEASRYAPEGKEHDNAAAAAIILQRYLDMRPPAVD